MGAEPAPFPLRHLWVIGPGRVGLALGLVLHRAGAVAALTCSGRRPTAPPHPLFAGPTPPARYRPGLDLPAPAPDAVLLAVPDDALAGLAAALAPLGLAPGTVVLHTSGSLDARVLAPLAAAGCETGSLHPLAAVADPVAGADRLRGAWYAVEGSGPAAALAARLVAAAEGRTLPLRSGGKASYHAAAVFASNYLVALLAVAERLMGAAGVGEEEARAALASLAAGALSNVAAAGPADALTGPVSRGDAATVRRHLAELSPPDRALYSLLAQEALALARRQGLDEARAADIEQQLGGVR